MGSQVTFLALPATAILLLQASPFQVGLLGALQFLAFPRLGLVAGDYVDRVKRRWIMIACDLGSMFALGSIPAAYVEMAYQSYLPALIPSCRRWCHGAPVGPRPDFAPWHRR